MSVLSPARRSAAFHRKTTVRPYGQTGTWNLAFEDQFTGSSLDTTKWDSGMWWATDGGGTNDANDEEEWYKPSQVVVGGNELRLLAEPEVSVHNTKTYTYKSGMVTTGPKTYGGGAAHDARFDFTYGYAEARIKMPKGKGLWPAFWMLSTDKVYPTPAPATWPPEIDIMEYLGPLPGTIHHHYHYRNAANTGNLDSGGAYSPVGADWSLDWHVYGMEWASTYIKWYVDGVESRTPFTETARIVSEPMYLILNMAIGGNWLDDQHGGVENAGNPDSTTPNPAVMQVDWVRVWKRPVADPVTATVEATV